MKVKYDPYLDGDMPKKDLFEAGAQLRQAEIDDLIDIVKTSADSEKYLFDELQEVKKERDELQKRIDEAMDELEYPKASWDEAIYNVIKTLKGKNND